jgi:mersacidin/lichenicidin family type 2 lantibiotic
MDLPTKSFKYFKHKENTMSYRDIIRAWKDEEYRLSLSEEQRAVLPEHPAGLIELEDAELDDAAGGTGGGGGTYNCPATGGRFTCAASCQEP